MNQPFHFSYGSEPSSRGRGRSVLVWMGSFLGLVAETECTRVASVRRSLSMLILHLTLRSTSKISTRRTGRSSRRSKTRQRRSPVGNLDPLKWWKLKEKIYLLESKLARRYLAIPASSAPCERLFSTGGRVLEKRRAAMKPETAKAIVFLHENLHLIDDLAAEGGGRLG